MVQTRHYNNLVWVDVANPSREEVLDLVKTYDLHPLVGEDMLSRSSKPHIEYHDTYIYLMLQIPVRSKVGGKYVIDEKEIDFVIGQNFLISVTYDTIESLHNFSKIFEADSIIDKKNLGAHAGFIFYYMMKQLYAHMIDDLENMKDALVASEDKIFSGDERHMVQVLSNLSRELIDLKQSSRLHKEVLEAFGPVAHTFFGKDFRFYIDDILKEYAKIDELAANNRELLTDLRETNDSLLSTKQNETMKTFTILAFITLPLTLFSSLFAMNTSSTPIVGHPFDFAIILGIMAVAALALLLFFKHKKWL